MKRETRIVSKICIWLLMVAIVAGTSGSCSRDRGND
jgi:hypothetical protein